MVKPYFVSKVMSLLFNTLSSFVIAFLWRSKHLLISWLPSPSEVILEPKKIKSLTVPIVSLSVCHEVMGCGGAIHCEAMMPGSSFPECWVLSRFFHSPVSPSSRGFLVPLHFLLVSSKNMVCLSLGRKLWNLTKDIFCTNQLTGVLNQLTDWDEF